MENNDKNTEVSQSCKNAVSGNTDFKIEDLYNRVFVTSVNDGIHYKIHDHHHNNVRITWFENYSTKYPKHIALSYVKDGRWILIPES